MFTYAFLFLLPFAKDDFFGALLSSFFFLKLGEPDSSMSKIFTDPLRDAVAAEHPLCAPVSAGSHRDLARGLIVDDTMDEALSVSSVSALDLMETSSLSSVKAKKGRTLGSGLGSSMLITGMKKVLTDSDSDSAEDRSVPFVISVLPSVDVLFFPGSEAEVMAEGLSLRSLVQ